MTNQAQINREAIADIKRRFQAGEIDYHQAKAEATPYIEAINARAVEIAKKHKMKPRKINFTGII